MNTPKVSVIVRAYNQEESIKKSIDSILAQKSGYTFEIIIGEDDSQKDRTRDVCEEYAAKHPDIVRLLPEAPNKGYFVNFIDCLKACRGEYVAMCDGDDWWHDADKLEMQATYLEMHPSCSMVYTDYDIFLIKENKTIKNILSGQHLPSDRMIDEILLGLFLPSFAVMFRRELLEHIDLDEFTKKGYGAEDMPLYLEFATHGSLDFLSVSTSTYMISKGSISQFDDPQKMFRFMSGVKKSKIDFINAHPDLTDIKAEQIERLTDSIIFRSSFMLGDRKMAKGVYGQIKSPSVKQKVLYLICRIPPLYTLAMFAKKIIKG